MGLTLRSDPHEYDELGEHRVVVKVIDILGNDTTHELRVTIEVSEALLDSAHWDSLTMLEEALGG